MKRAMKRKRPPPDQGLGKPVKRFDETFSAATVVEEMFFPKEKEVSGADHWCPFCKKAHPGGDTCMGHHP